MAGMAGRGPPGGTFPGLSYSYLVCNQDFRFFYFDAAYARGPPGAGERGKKCDFLCSNFSIHALSLYHFFTYIKILFHQEYQDEDLQCQVVCNAGYEGTPKFHNFTS